MTVIPETIRIKSNIFKAEDLAIYDTFIVPQNSPISEAIIAIKESAKNPFLDDPIFRIIANKDFEIIKQIPPVEYVDRNAWTVTLYGKTLLQRRENQRGFSIVAQEPAPVQNWYSCQLL